MEVEEDSRKVLLAQMFGLVALYNFLEYCLNKDAKTLHCGVSYVPTKCTYYCYYTVILFDWI